MSTIIGLGLRLRPEKCHFVKTDVGHTVTLTATAIKSNNAKGKVRGLTWKFGKGIDYR